MELNGGILNNDVEPEGTGGFICLATASVGFMISIPLIIDVMLPLTMMREISEKSSREKF